MIALSGTSARVPLPDGELFGGFSTLPGEQSTFVDVVVPLDRMQVVTTWERAQLSGLAQAQVRAMSAPDRALRLVFVDARHSFGVWIGMLAGEGQWRSGDRGPVLDASLMVPRRPRTATMHKNLYAVITDVDARVTQMLGWTSQQLVGHRSLEFMHPDDHERAISQWLEVRGRKTTQRIRLRHRHRDGHWLWVEVENSFIGVENPNETVVATQLTDISDEMAAHEAVRQRERLFHRLAESLPVGLFMIALDRSVVFANSRLAGVLGVAGAVTLEDQLATVIDSDRTRLEEAFAATLNDRRDQEVEVEICRPETGARRRCLITLAALSDEEGLPGAIVSVTDITASAQIRDELTVRATFDTLTGCHNRASTLASLGRALTEPATGCTAVIFLDLNKFKAINDRHGHGVGDELLIEVARRLSSALRSQDTLGRIGGDEFLIICPGIGDSAQALVVANRIRDTLHGDIRIAGHRLEPAASIGVAVSTHTSTTEQLVADADTAMYESKRLGAGTPVLFTDPPQPSMPTLNTQLPLARPLITRR